MALYDAFISYSHAKDKPIAAALQSVVQRLGKPWYKRRALRVFRDDTSLSATPQLWPSIEQALAPISFFDLARLAGGGGLAVGRQGDRLLARAQERRHAADRAHRRDAGLGRGARAISAGRRQRRCRRCSSAPFAAEPKWVDLAAYRDGAAPARRQVHRARRRLRRRHPRHPEGGPAVAGGAPAAARAAPGLVGGGGAARARRARRLADAGGASAARAGRERAHRGDRHRQYAGVRAGAGVPGPHRHAGRPGAQNPRPRPRSAEAAHRVRERLRPACGAARPPRSPRWRSPCAPAVRPRKACSLPIGAERSWKH